MSDEQREVVNREALNTTATSYQLSHEEARRTDENAAHDLPRSLWNFSDQNRQRKNGKVSSIKFDIFPRVFSSEVEVDPYEFVNGRS